ncbi:MAG: deoxyribodipyrimidine photo-lyase [Proteobacteria bacterium]|nr:deoxyribodipyrimidine photo-lyase [Pseudomonadota bacterium]
MSNNLPLSIVWLRNDLRLSDNPAFIAAASKGGVWPIYIFDTTSSQYLGSASRWWLHHSLQSLKDSLNGRLDYYVGNPHEILIELAQQHNIKDLYWNRCYEPLQMQQEHNVIAASNHLNITCHHFNGSLLWEPWEIMKDDGLPYKVFTPFYNRGYQGHIKPRSPEATSITYKLYDQAGSTTFSLLDKNSWYIKLGSYWDIGERAAQKKLELFIEDNLSGYAKARDYPADSQTSRLSPHLHFGEISPNQIWWALENLKRQGKYTSVLGDIERYQIELVWREFSYYLLYHHPTLPTQNLQRRFDHFPWQHNETMLQAWKTGQTGYPIIDAGMRELWQTGYMHNRVRMLVASFLVKNLLIDWRYGAAWFLDCLVDADLANNSASWQWVAGCGADAAPYFRIFNPIIQGEKFDPNGTYTKHFVPELAALPLRYLFKPWQAPSNVLQACNVALGRTYPQPIVDISATRKAALQAFRSLSN